jgi:hypothetical protein
MLNKDALSVSFSVQSISQSFFRVGANICVDIEQF